MSYFLITIKANPKDKKGYDIENAFNELGFIPQHQANNCKFSERDIVYIYLSKYEENPILNARIKYKCIVEKINIEDPIDDSKYYYYKEMFDSDKSKCYKYMNLKLVKRIDDDRLTYNEIKKNYNKFIPNFTKSDEWEPELFKYILSIDK